MKLTVVALVLVVCALVTAELEQKSDDITNKQDVNEVKDGGREAQEDLEESGSAELDTNEGSAESGDTEDETQPQMSPPKQKFKYFGFRGPVTITPMEPMVNKQRPYRRRCFFCFPRGNLGRVEMTAPGGPYLMNGFGPVNAFGMGYPDMGFPAAGPGFPDMDMGYPGMGGFGNGGPCCGGPCSGGPCCGGNSNQGPPMVFEGIDEEEPKAPAAKAHDKPMQQLPNKGAPQTLNKAMDQASNKVVNQSPNQAANKVAADDQPKKLQQAGNSSDKPSKTKP